MSSGGAITFGDQGDGRLPAEQAFQSIRATPYRIAATLSVTVSEHAGRTGYFDIAAGVTVTLPRATGSGAKFKFFVKTTVTSVADVIQVANADDTMQGNVFGVQDGGDTVEGWESAAASDTFTMDGSTKGGILGDWVEFEDVAQTVWSVVGLIRQTGAQATPFSAAVS